MSKQNFKGMSFLDKGITILDGGYILADDTLTNAYEKLWAKNPQLRARYEYSMKWLKQPLTSPNTNLVTEPSEDKSEVAKAKLDAAKNETPIMQALAAQMNLTRKSLGIR